MNVIEILQWFFLGPKVNAAGIAMVQDPGQYRWSSYRHNSLGQSDPRITPHPLYLAIDRDETDRQAAYRALFRSELDEEAPTSGSPCHKGSRWAMAVSATKSVRRRGSGARRSGQGDRQAKRSAPAMQKYKPISGFEQERMNMVVKRENEAKLTPFAEGRALLNELLARKLGEVL